MLLQPWCHVVWPFSTELLEVPTNSTDAKVDVCPVEVERTLALMTAPRGGMNAVLTGCCKKKISPVVADRTPQTDVASKPHLEQIKGGSTQGQIHCMLQTESGDEISRKTDPDF